MKKLKKMFLYGASIMAFIFMIAIGYMMAVYTPMQELKIAAAPNAGNFDLSGETSVYCLKPKEAGTSCRAVIQFMAVRNESDKLFTRFGSGQYVNMGCSRLEAGYDFTSLGRFLCVRLKMNAVQKDLKLEDGTPFDITRYSLRPVLTVGE